MKTRKYTWTINTDINPLKIFYGYWNGVIKSRCAPIWQDVVKHSYFSFIFGFVSVWMALFGYYTTRGSKNILKKLSSMFRIHRSGLFDSQYYGECHGLANRDALYLLAHYVLFGNPMQDNPNRLFNAHFYIRTNNLKGSATESPLEHFILYGQKKKNNSTNLFDWATYGALHRLKLSGIEVMRHAIHHGYACRHCLFEIDEYTNGVSEQLEFATCAAPRISIIVFMEEPDWVFHVLKSINETANTFAFELIILCNFGDGGKLIETYSNGAKIVNLSPSYPAAAAFSQEFHNARGSYLLYLGGATVVRKDTIQHLVDSLDGDSTRGMVGARVVLPDGILSDGGRVIHANGMIDVYGMGGEPDAPQYNYLKQVDCLSPACMLIRCKTALQLGGFDELYQTIDYAAADMAMKIRSAGGTVVYQPQAVVVTPNKKNAAKSSSKDRERFFERWEKQLKNEYDDSSRSNFKTRDRQRGNATILVIDSHVPHFDRDAGSRSTCQYLMWFVELGFNVKFIGDNFFPHQPYTRILQEKGIEVLYGPWMAENWPVWLRENTSELDYIYLHRPEIAQKYLEVIDGLKGPKRLYFGHDLHYMRLRRQYEIEGDENILREAVDQERIEYEVFGKVDAVYYPSSVEVNEILRKAPQVKARAIPLYLIDDVPVRPHRFQERQGMLFVGGFRHRPNVDAMQWFVRDVLPLITSEDKSQTLYIAGSNMPDSIRSLECRNVRIMGQVSDEELQALYTQCRVCVVPLRYGAGIKGKILESLEWQIPIVTTSIGAEGMPEAANYMAIADTANDFARAILRIYYDEETWCAMVQMGREILISDFSKRKAHQILCHDIRLPVIESKESALWQ